MSQAEIASLREKIKHMRKCVREAIVMVIFGIIMVCTSFVLHFGWGLTELSIAIGALCLGIAGLFPLAIGLYFGQAFAERKKKLMRELDKLAVKVLTYRE